MTVINVEGMYTFAINLDWKEMNRTLGAMTLFTEARRSKPPTTACILQCWVPKITV
jgi:hypothetical protein